MSRETFDVAIIGSGPAGAQAAEEAVGAGLSVALIDVGFQDEKYEPTIPAKNFRELRRTDSDQRRYFLGENLEALEGGQKQAGIHLSPGRMHIVRHSEKVFPSRSRDFFALQSTSLGGLGAAWGANVFTFENNELEKAGLPAGAIRDAYLNLARSIGVSGPSSSDLDPFIPPAGEWQPPLELDSNAKSVKAVYDRKRENLQRHGFHLGQSVMAILSKPLGDRGPNPHCDMDFWADFNHSVYRPRYTIFALKQKPNFRYIPNHACRKITRGADGALNIETLNVTNLENPAAETFQARRVILAGGAIGSGKIALQSLGAAGDATPLLCNRNHWWACLNLRMLGKPAQDGRYSLSQLTAIQVPPERPDERLVAHFFSYRSLLLYRLIQQMPFHPWITLPLSRVIENALTMLNVHFSDNQPGTAKIVYGGENNFEIFNQEDATRAAADYRDERALLKNVRSLGVMPLKRAVPVAGASIHYAGSLPFSGEFTKFGAKPNGELWGLPGVFVADASTWRYLPAKGLTFTIMANARVVAKNVSSTLK